MIAALFVQTNGVYFDLPNINPWDEARDARLYAGPYPVIAHPPCARWGRFWHGSPRKPHQYKMGDDDGCFASALASVRQWGGVLEHPEQSNAWFAFGLNMPLSRGWSRADDFGWVCRVEQGKYGHIGRKPTWLYVVGSQLLDLRWGMGPQVLSAAYLERHGYEKARRCGMISMIGGKHKKKIREATPIEFRDLLISMVEPKQAQAA